MKPATVFLGAMRLVHYAHFTWRSEAAMYSEDRK